MIGNLKILHLFTLRHHKKSLGKSKTTKPRKSPLVEASAKDNGSNNGSNDLSNDGHNGTDNGNNDGNNSGNNNGQVHAANNKDDLAHNKVGDFKRSNKSRQTSKQKTKGNNNQNNSNNRDYQQWNSVDDAEFDKSVKRAYAHGEEAGRERQKAVDAAHMAILQYKNKELESKMKAPSNDQRKQAPIKHYGPTTRYSIVFDPHPKTCHAINEALKHTYDYHVTPLNSKPKGHYIDVLPNSNQDKYPVGAGITHPKMSTYSYDHDNQNPSNNDPKGPKDSGPSM